MPEIEVGFITHYFGHINVAAIQLTHGEVAVGDTLHIKGHTSDFTTRVESMQVNHASVTTAKKGDGIGIKTPEHARENDKVFKVVP
ncbi:MAG: translation elongation factor-like protein [Lentisphaerae bacterium]|nr:translation elongation factor-like protein [Lentisphaerota bacterium]